ncbi:ENTH/VHS family protein [Actinidia rufa]|uniref:ENTH/VHS family protein n=1 Tax=Actinidia rufa TaxID=165716 RepID=A0A7J0EL05_9ERIC|nr:ENTH/VHS family protein [Actinidia rufa]
MNKAKQVVETLDKQFHYSPHEQQLAFLYLANDILQNSRRKGSEFVGEFCKVLPNALRDVIENGDEFSRNAALRLISIWEVRKVFGSRGKILKEELTGRPIENSNRNGKDSGFKLRHSAGNALDQIASCYQVLYSGQLDEDAIVSKCRNAIGCIEKVDKEIGDDHNPVESSTANLVYLLRDALQEQEFKLDQIRNQLQAAQPQSEQVAPVMYTWIVPLAEKPGQDPKAAAAAMAAKLTASTASAQMLSYAWSQQVPPYPHPDSIQHSIPITQQELTANDLPPLPSSSPPLPPIPSCPMPQFMQTSESGCVPYGYGTIQHQPSPMQGYPSLGPPVSGVSPFTAPPSYTYQSFQGSEGGCYSQPASM